MAVTLVISVLLPLLASGSNVVPFSLTSVDVVDGALSVSDMESVFARTDAAHRISISSMAKTMTVPKAFQVLRELKNVTDMENAVMSLIGGQGQLQNTALRGDRKKQPSGYSGIEGARKMLNDMIFESMSKYDTEIAKCTEFYSKQCALMEVARGQIAAANFVAANSRALILDAQGNINKCEVAIPSTKQELVEHNVKCAHELQKLNTRLQLVMGDIAVMTMILKMTDCDAKFVQMKKLVLLRCKNDCTGQPQISFNHKDLQKMLGQLKSSKATGLMQKTFEEMTDPTAPLQAVQLMQVDNQGFQEPIVNKTAFNNPPVPRTKVPGNPCQDPDKGAPSDADKRAAKCTLSKGPQCYKLQGRFLAIQGGIVDERDELLENKAKMEADCKDQKETLETKIADDQDLLDSSQTKLAMATEKESTAAEEARQTAKENEQYNNDLVKQMKTCSTNYISFETEICALKKIRGELYKLKGSGHSAFFQDCEVSKWDPEECTRVCAGGEQKLIRSVLTPRKDGTKCLPLEAMRSCNNQPCPVDCKLDAWGGWSKCSADCGGGVQQRVRDVVMAMKFDGKPCSARSEAKACNVAACEKHCVLAPWTKFTKCSKDCDGGTKMREKFVKEPAEGSGKCPGKWTKERIEYKECAEHRCWIEEGKQSKTCNNTMDVILVIDTCPKTGEKAFKAQLAASKIMIDAFTDVSKTRFAVINYCGPKTWSGVSKCTGKNSNTVDVKKDCHVGVHSHFTGDKKNTKNLIDGLTYDHGTKLTALALLAAKSELSLGNKDAHSVVIVFQDGQPLSFRKTELAARSLRRSARLLFVVISKFAPLGPIKKWATRRWQENLVEVDSAKALGEPGTITAVIADICPSPDMEEEFDMSEMDGDLM